MEGQPDPRVPLQGGQERRVCLVCRLGKDVVEVADGLMVVDGKGEGDGMHGGGSARVPAPGGVGRGQLHHAAGRHVEQHDHKPQRDEDQAEHEDAAYWMPCTRSHSQSFFFNRTEAVVEGKIVGRPEPQPGLEPAPVKGRSSPERITLPVVAG